MTRRNFLTGAVAVSTLFSTTACSQVTGGGKHYPDYRYRLTVEVDTPEGLKTGSSVIEVSTKMSGKNSIPDPGKVFTEVRGEAVVVDLGPRGTLFALLRSEESVDWAAGPLLLMVPQVKYGEIEDVLEKENHDPSFDMRMQKLYKLTEQYELPRHYYNVVHKPRDSDPPTAYPTMVMFKDMTDPKSVTKIDADNLAATFGDGVKLKRLTVERTEDPATSGIEQRLGWLSATKGSLTKQPRDPVTKQLIPIGQTSLSTQLGHSDFIRSKP